MKDDGMMFKELDMLLMRRAQPEMPEGMCERIIAAAIRADEAKAQRLSVVKTKARGFWAALVHDFSEMLYVPRPAYVFATLLVMGISMGVYGDYVDNLFMPGMTTDELSGFMNIEDRFVATEFLGDNAL